MLKVEVKEIKKEIEYPCLMQATDDKQIVLMLSDKVGVDLNTGFYCECWNMEKFIKFTSTIILSNEN